MAFREHPGFTITTDWGTRQPKGKIRPKKLKADRATVGGDLTPAKAEAAIWLVPRYRNETRQEIRDHLRR